MITFLCSLFQWEHAKGSNVIVKVLLEYGVDLVAPIRLWGNTYVGNRCLMCKHPDVVQLIFDRFDSTSPSKLGNRVT